MITSLYLALLTLVYVAMAFYIVYLRNKHKVGIGAGNIAELERSIRIHGNFQEYVPICILLLYFCESHALLGNLGIHLLGMAITTGRLFHARGLSQTKGFHILRFLGMVFTFTSMLVMAFLLIISAL
jgi:uncharacterized membrane protein YecN with MAPEG domain